MLNLRNKTYQALRRSESFFKTDMIYLAKGGIWITFGGLVSTVSLFALSIAFANLLPKETYGTYKYILAMAGTLGIFTLTGMGTAVTQAVARGSDGVLMPAFMTRLRFSLLGSLVSFIGSAYYYLNGNITISLGLLIIGLFMPLMESLDLYNSVWQGKKRFDITTQYFIIGQIAYVSISIITLFLTQNVLILVLVYFSTWTIFRALFFKNTLKRIEPREIDASSTLSYGKHLSIMEVIGVVANYADRILIFHYVGAAEAAIYSIAIAMPEQIKGLFKGIGSLALPKFSEKSEVDIRKSIWGKIWKITLLLVAVTVIYIVSAPYIFKLLFPLYLESIFYSQIMAISLVTAISVVPLSYLQAHQKKDALYAFNIASSLIQIILLFLGAYFYGLLGVVIVRVLSRFIAMFIALGLIVKPAQT